VFDAAIHIAGNPGSVVTTGGAVDGDGNQYMTGRFHLGEIDFDLGGSHPGNVDLLTPSGDGYDGFVAKYDADGEFLWARSFGGPGDPDDLPWRIATDGFGNAYVSGEFNGSADFGPFFPGRGVAPPLLVEQHLPVPRNLARRAREQYFDSTPNQKPGTNPSRSQRDGASTSHTQRRRVDRLPGAAVAR
jgi:hypothetical protein